MRRGMSKKYTYSVDMIPPVLNKFVSHGRFPIHEKGGARSCLHLLVRTLELDVDEGVYGGGGQFGVGGGARRPRNVFHHH